MNKSTYKLLGLSVTLFCLSLAAVVFVVHKQEQLGNEVRERLVELKAWESVANAALDLTKSTEEQPDLQSRLRSRVLLSEGDAVEFLAYVESMANRVGVDITTSSLEEEKISDPDFNELAATFSLRGPSLAVERLIRILEVLPYRSRIERMTLTRGLETTSALVVVRVSSIK